MEMRAKKPCLCTVSGYRISDGLKIKRLKEIDCFALNVFRIAYARTCKVDFQKQTKRMKGLGQNSRRLLPTVLVLFLLELVTSENGNRSKRIILTSVSQGRVYSSSSP